MPPEALFNLRTIDCNRVLVDLEGIRKVNTQRFEMEQLTAVVYIDPIEHVCIGYKEVRGDEFWARGHMPGYPLMPGVLICEAAAQLSSYYCHSHKLFGDEKYEFIAFGGMNDVRFRGPVRPGDRLVLIAKAIKINRRQIISATQGYVGQMMVFQGEIIGMPFTSPQPLSDPERGRGEVGG